MSKITKQSVDTTLPKAIYKWIIAREEAVKIMNVEVGRLGELPALIKTMKASEKSIKSVKDRIVKKTILAEDVAYVEEQYEDFVKGLDKRRDIGPSGSKKELPFIKENGDIFTAQDITDAMKGGNFPSGFLGNRMSNKNSVEFKTIQSLITPNKGMTDNTRKSESLDVLRNPTDEKKEEPKPTLTKEEQATENMKKEAEDKKQKEKEQAEEKEAEDKAKVAAEQKLQQDAEEKEEKEEEAGVELKGLFDGDGDEEKEGEVIKLEDVAEEDGLKFEPVGPVPAPLDVGDGDADGDDFKDAEGDGAMPDTPRGDPPPIDKKDPDELPDNRGTVEERNDVLDASRGGAGMTPSGIVKGGDSSAKEDAQRGKMNIARLKEEIRALHLIYDNNIDKFRSNPHKADKDDALKSDSIEVVRKHHRDMELSIREYYRSGGGDTLRVGVIVPIDTYLSQYLSGGTPNEVSIPTRTTGKEGTTSVGLGSGHRDTDLKSKKHDPYSRAIAQGIYYQRGGIASYKQRGVTGHNIKIGGKVDKIGQVKDPRARVDAVMNNFLNRTVKELPNPSLKLKTK